MLWIGFSSDFDLVRITNVSNKIFWTIESEIEVIKESIYVSFMVERLQWYEMKIKSEKKESDKVL